MEIFYITVVVVATAILIILLTIIGIILSQKNNSQVFPPSKTTCPDYWTSSTNSGNTVVCTISDLNKGKINLNNTNLTTDKNDNSKIFTPGFNGSTINFSDPNWATGYGTTQQCALNKWANQNNINWDGISNYNGC